MELNLASGIAVIKHLVEYLRDPRLSDVDIDSDARLRAHNEILADKLMIQVVFRELHELLMKLAGRFDGIEGLRVELGAGVAPIRNSFPSVLATDVVDAPYLDLVLDAENMSLRDKSVGVFFAQNTFHHFPHPEHFFKELNRTLIDGGGAILLEPYYGPFATFLFQRLFKSEGFDKSFPSWETPAVGPMNGANQALSYIVFKRDRTLFEQMFPSLKIVGTTITPNYLKYLVSGGLNFRQVLPDFTIPLLTGLETALGPLRNIFGLHHVVILQKSEK